MRSGTTCLSAVAARVAARANAECLKGVYAYLNLSSSASRCSPVSLCLLPARAQGGPIDAGLAAQYFREARAACERDGGRLWGVSPCGPILFVEPQTRGVVANQPDAEGQDH